MMSCNLLIYFRPNIGDAFSGQDTTDDEQHTCVEKKEKDYATVGGRDHGGNGACAQDKSSGSAF